MDAINFNINIRDIGTALFWIIAIIVVAINYARRRYELNKINSDHIIISRFLMAERSLYKEDINKLVLKELPKEKAKLMIYSSHKVLNFRRIDIEVYSSLVEFAKKNNLTFYFENINGIKTIMKE